jgi:starch synthase
MKIVITASECVPFAKSGGLADVIGALPKVIKKKSHDVRVIIPKYKKIDDKKFALKSLGKFPVPMGWYDVQTAELKYTVLNDVTFYFIANDQYFNREEMYRTGDGDYPDNAERFIFFSKAVLEALKVINFKPDVIHCNDWQTGLIPAYLKTSYKYDTFFLNTATLYTIHNLAYQGVYEKDVLPLTGIGWEEFTQEKLEYWDKISFMKAGLVYADIINTVSVTYSKEIQASEEYGRGMEGVLNSRSKDLYGVINGVDYDDWDPAKDKFLASNYSLKNAVIGKEKCKKDLLKETGLSGGKDVPVIGMITRLDPQKGLDILALAMKEIVKLDIQFILLGKGDDIYHELFKKIQQKYPRKVSVNFTFNDPLAHKIYAGSDIFLMPSHFEPCGLGQLISFKYGTLPIVYKTGGLADTVIDYNEKTQKGNGFVFDEYTPQELVKTVKRALDVYNKNKKDWTKLIERAMSGDFSWNDSAVKYLDLYKKGLAKK